jgi:hypothetical protein
MTLAGNYKEHKDYVMAKMEKQCMALADADSIPRGELRELAVTSGIVAIFRATAGVVPWTGTELDRVSQLWIRAFKQAWTVRRLFLKTRTVAERVHRRGQSGRRIL